MCVSTGQFSAVNQYYCLVSRGAHTTSLFGKAIRVVHSVNKIQTKMKLVEYSSTSSDEAKVVHNEEEIARRKKRRRAISPVFRQTTTTPNRTNNVEQPSLRATQSAAPIESEILIASSDDEKVKVDSTQAFTLIDFSRQPLRAKGARVAEGDHQSIKLRPQSR